MGKYDPMLENDLRRNQVIGTFQEVLDGSGPPFFMDMRHFEPEDARHLQYDLMPSDKETYLDYCRARDIDVTKKLLEVEISKRMIEGVIHCTDEQESNITNLSSASLLNTFSGSMCLGWSAGLFAAKRAQTVNLPTLPEAQIAQERLSLYAPPTRGNGCVSHPIRRI